MTSPGVVSFPVAAGVCCPNFSSFLLLLFFCFLLFLFVFFCCKKNAFLSLHWWENWKTAPKPKFWLKMLSPQSNVWEQINKPIKVPVSLTFPPMLGEFSLKFSLTFFLFLSSRLQLKSDRNFAEQYLGLWVTHWLSRRRYIWISQPEKPEPHGYPICANNGSHLECPTFQDPNFDFGNAYYNDHHFHYGSASPLS